MPTCPTLLRPLLVALALAIAAPAAAQQPAAQPAVDLKLFATEEADRSRGCTFAL